ncbi:MAG: tyrosine-type recombinase/integrase [Acidimicrobiales bacterium]
MASVEKRPNGQWRARWREYPGGPQRTKQFARKVDAEQHLVKTQHSLLTGSYVDPTKSRTTVEEFYRIWSDRQPWRITTKTAVATTFETHVLPTFGKRPLGSIRRGDLEGWAAKLPLATGSVRLAMQHLGSMLGAAVTDGLLVANPADQTKRPRAAAHPVTPLTAGEVVRLREAAPPWFAVALTLGAGCGLRLSEATGLTVDRVDFLRRELTVDRQMLPIGDLEFGPPKTERSYRKVPLANMVVAELARHVEVHGTGRDGLVLHRDGEPMRRQRFGDVWRATRGGASLPDARYHDTRHTYASVLLSGGVSVAAAAEYLGHSPAMLLSTYAHLMPADHDRARAVVEAAFTVSAAGLAETAED